MLLANAYIWICPINLIVHGVSQIEVCPNPSYYWRYITLNVLNSALSGVMLTSRVYPVLLRLARFVSCHDARHLTSPCPKRNTITLFCQFQYFCFVTLVKYLSFLAFTSLRRAGLASHVLVIFISCFKGSNRHNFFIFQNAIVPYTHSISIFPCVHDHRSNVLHSYS